MYAKPVVSGFACPMGRTEWDGICLYLTHSCGEVYPSHVYVLCLSLLFVTSEHLFVANGFYPQDTRVTWGDIILVSQMGASGLEKPSAAQKVVMGPCTGQSQVET